MVGIATAPPAGVRPWVFLLLWTLLMPMFARPLAGMVMGFAPLYVTTGYMISLQPHSEVAPTVSLSLMTKYRMLGRAGAPGLPGASGTARGTADRPSATLTLPPVAGVSGGTFPTTAMISSTANAMQLGEGPYDAKPIADYLAGLNAAIPREDIEADAAELAALLNAWTTTATFTTTRFGFTGGNGIGPVGPAPAGWYAPTVFAGFFALYVAGVVLFLAIHARRAADRRRV
jgi:hypothetical protein